MPASIAIDAIVAVKALVAEPSSDKARAVIAGNDLIVAPAHAYAEIAEIIHRKHMAGEIDEYQVGRALLRLPDILTFVALDGLIADAFLIARTLHCSVHQCLYLAVARKHRVALISADRRLLERIQGTGFAKTVFDLDSYRPQA